MRKLTLIGAAFALAIMGSGGSAMAQNYGGWGMMDGYGPRYGQGRMQGYGYEHGPGMMWDNGSGYGPGMMQGYGPSYRHDDDGNERRYRRGYGRGMMGPGWNGGDDD